MLQVVLVLHDASKSKVGLGLMKHPKVRYVRNDLVSICTGARSPYVYIYVMTPFRTNILHHAILPAAVAVSRDVYAQQCIQLSQPPRIEMPKAILEMKRPRRHMLCKKRNPARYQYYMQQDIPRHGLCSHNSRYPTNRNSELNQSSDDTVAAQLLDLVVAGAQHLPKNFVGVLTQERRRTPYSWRRVGVLDRRIHHFDGPARGMFDLGHHISRKHYKQPWLA